MALPVEARGARREAVRPLLERTLRGAGWPVSALSLETGELRTPEGVVFGLVSDASEGRERARDALVSRLRSHPTARLGLLADGDAVVIGEWRAATQDLKLLAELPAYGAARPARSRAPGTRTGLRPLTPQDGGLFFEMHSTLRDVDGLHAPAALDELCKLIFAKVWDERRVVAGAQEAPRFRASGGTAFETAATVRDVYDDARRADAGPHAEGGPERAGSRGVFSDPLLLSDEAIAGVVEHLEGVTILESTADVRGLAFQRVLTSAVRFGMGQYFTPEPVVGLAIGILDPRPTETLLDPFCGSAHFLGVALENASRLREEVGERLLKEFARLRLHGIEKSAQMCRIAVTDMVLHDDGHGTIRHADALLDPENYPDLAQRRDDGTLDLGTFDAVATNPPFGSTLKVVEGSAISRFETARGRDAVPLEVLGLERSLQFLKPGGRLAIVLPDGILNTRQMQFVRDFIFRHARVLAVVSLPPQTFAPYEGVGKASVLFLRKERVADASYPVFLAVARHVGYDNTNRAEARNDLPGIVAAYRDWTQGRRVDPEVAWTAPASALRENLSAVAAAAAPTGSGWPRRRLREVATCFAGRTPPRARYTEEGHRVVKVRDLTGEGLNWSAGSRAFVDADFFTRARNAQLRVGDIVLTAAAHHPKYIGLKVDVVDRIPPEYANGVLPVAELLVIRADPAEVDPYYLLLWLRSSEGYAALQSKVTGQTAHLYASDVNDIQVPLPPPEARGDVEAAAAALRRSLELRAAFKAAVGQAQDDFNRLLGAPPRARANEED